MMAQDRAMTREAAQQEDRPDQLSARGRTSSAGAMALQSGRGHEAAPQAFVRLSGSHLAKPRIGRDHITE